MKTTIAALVDFNRRRRLENLAKKFGTFDGIILPDELQTLREQD
jgi:hypothetical protein